jgi:hypothetical protein
MFGPQGEVLCLKCREMMKLKAVEHERYMKKLIYNCSQCSEERLLVLRVKPPYSDESYYKV